jgi:hypothetical protein
MRRSALALVLVMIPAALLGRGWTPAHGAVAGHVCFDPATYVQAACTPTPAATAVAIPITKTLNVSAALPTGPGISNYYVTLQSSMACFPLNEPIDVYTFGNTGEAALSPATPGTFPVQNPDQYRVTPDQFGTAVLSLEVFTAGVGPDGLTVKAIWPQEGVEQIAPVIPGATPGPTDTGTPEPATATPVMSPSPTPTPGPTETATAVPTTTRPFFLRTCVSPNPTGTSTQATVYVETLPGATCTASVTFSNGTTAADLADVAQTVGSPGTAGFTFTVDQTATSGTAAVTCAYDGESGKSASGFLIGSPTPTPTLAP